MKTIAFKPEKVAPIWQRFQESLPVKLAPIRNEAHYRRMVLFLNNLIDTVGEEEGHELANLLDVVGRYIEDYESESGFKGSPHETLRFLMQQHGLRQVDLKDEVGGQSVISAILNGHRAISASQAKALAGRFGVSVTVFI